jgi:putative ABC transport system ATP-binding protein
MPLVQLDKIQKVYNAGQDNQVAALKSVDLGIEQGEFVAIMGASGSGKSTLMHVIGFLDRPTHGRYFFDGRDVTSLSDNELAEIRNQRVGFVFQSFNLLARTSALDNVALPMLYAPQKGSVAAMNARATELLQMVGLGNRLGHMPSELSGGQQQRVAIARALVNNPAVIFADEPTGNLDSKSSVEIMNLFQQLNKEGHTLIFVTHEENIADFAKRIIKLKDGEIVSDQRSN